MAYPFDFSREVLGDERIAFACTVDMGDGRRIIEHVIAEVRDGKIVPRRRRGVGLISGRAR